MRVDWKMGRRRYWPAVLIGYSLGLCSPPSAGMAQLETSFNSSGPDSRMLKNRLNSVELPIPIFEFPNHWQSARINCLSQHGLHQRGFLLPL